MPPMARYWSSNLIGLKPLTCSYCLVGKRSLSVSDVNSHAQGSVPGCCGPTQLKQVQISCTRKQKKVGMCCCGQSIPARSMECRVANRGSSPISSMVPSGVRALLFFSFLCISLGWPIKVAGPRISFWPSVDYFSCKQSWNQVSEWMCHRFCLHYFELCS